MSVPERIGKYRVLDLIGTGGFGQVFRARDPYLNRDVAIKLCALEDAELVERFAREAKISGSLHHPHIVIVHDFGYTDGRPYLVQELLPGRDLDDIVRSRQWMAYPRRFSILLQVAEAVSYAHSRGIVHRDIKPGNIRILPDGTVKVLDFGIARFAHAGTRLTSAGMSLGTIGYLAPEQIRGEDVDRRADVFSFGVLAYELLSYRRPFQAESAFTVLHQILQIDPAPLSDVWPDCPPPIDACVMRCLARDRAVRFAGFDDLLPELEAAFQQAEADGTLPAAPPTGQFMAPAKVPSSARDVSDLDLSATQPLPSLPFPAEAGVTSATVPRPSFWRRLFPFGGGGRTRQATAAEVGHPSPSETGQVRLPSQSYDTALGRLGGRHLWVALSGVAVLFAIGLATGVRLRQPPRAPQTTAAPPLVRESFGVVQIEALPWAHVERIRDAEGERWSLDGVSPLRLELPAGRYTIVLSHPEFEGPWLCRVEVSPERESRCEVVLPEMSTQDYFRRVGWYR